MKVENLGLDLNLKSGLNLDQAKVLQQIEKMYKLLLSYHVFCKPYSQAAFQKLFQVTDPAKLRGMADILQPTIELLEEITPSEHEESYEDEVAALRKALSKFGLRVDNEFWTCLHKGEVIEVYGDNMIQLHRSFNFYNKTSYSLLDLVVHEWFVLWERPEKVLHEILGMTADIINGKRSPGPCELRPHLVREIFDSGSTEPFVPRNLAVNFRYIFPLYRSVGSDIHGFIITSTCNVISVGHQNLQSLYTV